MCFTMKKIAKMLLVLSCAATVAMAGAATASAAELTTPQTPDASAAAVINPANPCSDVIEVKLRYTSDNRVQYRRWNATQGYWVDPYWIDLP